MRVMEDFLKILGYTLKKQTASLGVSFTSSFSWDASDYSVHVLDAPQPPPQPPTTHWKTYKARIAKIKPQNNYHTKSKKLKVPAALNKTQKSQKLTRVQSTHFVAGISYGG